MLCEETPTQFAADLHESFIEPSPRSPTSQGPMTKHLLRDLENLKKQVLLVGSLVEGAILKATTALLERRPELAAEVLHGDDAIDSREVMVEEECLKILALHQPVAIDLRLVIAVIKINNDLERIGDLAVNIAERAIFLAARPPVDFAFDFAAMSLKTRNMLKQALDAFVNLDSSLAQQVCAADYEVDEMNRRIYPSVHEAIRRQPDRLEDLLHLLSVSRYLERIADHATNIAEDVIYLNEGEIVRHRAKGFRAKKEGT